MKSDSINKIFRIKKGDTAPPLAVQVLQDSNNEPLDLSGASAKFSMYRTVDGTIKKTDASTASIYDPTNGKIKYDWYSTDTNTPGTYFGEFTITLRDSKITTIPAEGYIQVEILDKVGE